MQVLLGSLDGRRFTAEEAQKPIWFGEVAVGAKQQRVVRVSNPTPLPLPFCWQQTDQPVSSGKPCTLLLMLACLIRQASLASILAYLIGQASYFATLDLSSSGKPCTLLLMLACLIKQAWHLLTLSPCLPDWASLARGYRQSLVLLSGQRHTLVLMLACLIKQACHLLTLSPCLPACASLARRYRQSLMVSSGKPCTAHNMLLASKLRHRNSLQSN